MKQGALFTLLISGVLILASDNTIGQTGPITEATNLAGTRRVPAQYSTIQSAIDASTNGDTVLVSDGTYAETIRFRGKKIIVASTYLTTGDTSHISHTIIDGSGQPNLDSASVVYFISGEDTNSVLCGFTVRGGRGTSFGTFREGGGILVTSGARLVRNTITGNTVSGGEVYAGGVAGENGLILIMEYNTIAGNTLDGTWGSGGGVGIYMMTAILRNNTISDNTVTTQGIGSGSHAGGLDCEIGTFLIEGNLIARNRALAPAATQHPSYGGGVILRAGAATFRNNRVIGNVLQTSTGVRAYGGGICLLAAGPSELSDMVVAGNYIASNTVIGGSINALLSGGGGIFSMSQRPRIENNIIVRNTAPYGGGFGAGIYSGSASASNAVSGNVPTGTSGSRTVRHTIAHSAMIPDAPILINNTIAHNRATVDGGAMAISGSVNPTVVNTIAWGDTGTQEIYPFSGAPLTVTYSDIAGGYAGVGNRAVNPRFVDSTYRLSDSSMCIGTGIDSIQTGGVWYKPVATSFYGIARPSPAGSHPDIGACENVRANPISGVDEAGPSTPIAFALEQNFPNPFNPNSDIRYQIPAPGAASGSEFRMVRLGVYDLLGREVVMLVNEAKPAGTYTVRFDASGLSSGTYFYRMTAGAFIQTRKMVVVK